jgi:hypothetical protein
MTHPAFNQIEPAAVARVRAGIKSRHEPVKKKPTPRRAYTYRAARRNKLRGPIA